MDKGYNKNDSVRKKPFVGDSGKKKKKGETIESHFCSDGGIAPGPFKKEENFCEHKFRWDSLERGRNPNRLTGGTIGFGL